MQIEVYEQSDGKYLAMHPAQSRLVAIAFDGEDVDPAGTYHQGRDFVGAEVNIHPTYHLNRRRNLSLRWT
jgi:hypothetical protein